MRKIIVVALVAALAFAVVLDRGIGTEPAVTGAGESVDVGATQLPELGPLTLIDTVYTPDFTAACVDLNFITLYFVSFNGSDVGSSGTITSALGTSPDVQLNGGTVSVLGETDSEGFLDELAENGFTISYFVSSLDDQGHESGGSLAASGTARPDYHNEWVWDFFDRPELSGFRFPEDEFTDPILSGSSVDRHFRLETDAGGWWLVPGPNTDIYPFGFETTSLKCGPGADSSCSSLDVAPTSGYTLFDVSVVPQTTYVMRVRGNDGATHYAVVRITLQGFDQNDDAIMIFDWAYQLQAGNPNLSPLTRTSVRTR